MARDPGSIWKPLPEAGAPDGYAKTQFIYHSTGTLASAAANWAYFARANVVVESTFIIGWGPDDPTLQIMDSTDRADANMSASVRAIAVEVVGDGTGPYNDWQIAECIRLGLFGREEHGILPRIIPSESEGGFGWHVMFGAPGPWTDVRGKVCPGGRRIQQLQDTVFPAIFAGTPLTISEDYMSSDDAIIRLQKIQASLSLLESVAARPLDAETRLNARLDALTNVVQQLAEKQGTPIDMAAVEAVVEKGVQDAIAGIETTVTVKPSA